MKKKLLKVFTTVAIISSNSPVLSMQDTVEPLTQADNQDGVYTLNTKEKILKLIRDGKLNSNYAFFSTVVIRKTENGFIRQGDLSSITEQDLNDIRNENYVYTGHYSEEKTKLSPNCEMPVAAIIIGTRDSSDINKSK